jgi:hypothetical protein
MELKYSTVFIRYFIICELLIPTRDIDLQQGRPLGDGSWRAAFAICGARFQTELHGKTGGHRRWSHPAAVVILAAMIPMMRGA